MDWRTWYASEKELGRGISATVHRARASGGGPFSVCCSTAAGVAELFTPGGNGCDGSFDGCGVLLQGSRRIALKQFRKVARPAFLMELAALKRIDVHPNVVRLLESFPGGRKDVPENSLAYEYCEGLSLGDALALAHGRGSLLPAVLVARLFRQLLQALEHIGLCGIEHQDVKPDNCLLYRVDLPKSRAGLKLADFGWATVGPWRENQALPKGGIGSLWYAPPELNPPLKEPEASGDAAQSKSASATRSTRATATRTDPDSGRSSVPPAVGGDAVFAAAETPEVLEILQAHIADHCAAKHATAGVGEPPDVIRFQQPGVPTSLAVGDAPCRPSVECQGGRRENPLAGHSSGASARGRELLRQPIGRSDMWSAGCVLYLLLTGRNAFHAANRVQSSGMPALEAEVMRLVAAAEFDTSSAAWKKLSGSARSLIGAMLRVRAEDRPSPTQALKHDWLREVLLDEMDETVDGSASMRGPPFAAKEERWRRLDGFQRLAWLAVARAAAEPELSLAVVDAAAAAALRAGSCCGRVEGCGYLWHLAVEMVACAPGAWLAKVGALPDILRLAFSYIDVDSDGTLSERDLAAHVQADPEVAEAQVKEWVALWGSSSSSRSPTASDGHTSMLAGTRSVDLQDAEEGLTPSDLQAAILGVHAGGERSERAAACGAW